MPAQIVVQQQVAAPLTTTPGAPGVMTTAPSPVVATAAASAAPAAAAANVAVAAQPAVASYSKGEEVSASAPAAAAVAVVAGGDGSFETMYKHPLFDAPIPAYEPSCLYSFGSCYNMDK